SPQTVKARSLLCFWAHRKLGMTTVDIAKKLNICQSAASRSSLRGEKIERENQFEIIGRNA
ncbi:MAG: transposase, partial [Thermodesulfobacteriota bacterium]|nr:transposase [Thermodesulfobacteriota bacterium]